MMPAKKIFALACLTLTGLILAACSGIPGGNNGGGGGGTPGKATFTIGGTVTGLAGTGLVLVDNGTDMVTITGTGTVGFTFKTAVASGAVSVVPHDEVSGIRRPIVRVMTFSSRVHRSCGSAAPA